MKRASVFAFLLAFFAMLVLPSAFPSPVHADASTVVKVVTAQGLGAGVHIGNGYVITAAHVVAGVKTGADVTLKTRPGEEIDAEVLWSNEDYDVALLWSGLPKQLPKSDLSCSVPAQELPCKRVGR